VRHAQGRTCSSIGEEKAHNPRLTQSKEEFVQLMANLGLPYPKQIDRALPANLEDGAKFPYA
jgi:sulfur dioxygenase